MNAYDRHCSLLPVSFGILILMLGTSSPAQERSEAASTARLTENGTILLADFDNRTGQVVFDGALKEALAIVLGQSPFINVLSDRKVGEALGMMGHAANEEVTPEMGRQLCLRTGSKAVLAGTLAR